MIDLINNIRIFLSRLTAARAGYLDNINNANLSTIADISTLTATEIAYLDASVAGRATPTQVNTEVDSALDTAIPGAPTANSINERIKTIDDHDLVTKIPGVVTAVGPTKAEMDTAHGLLATPAQVNTEVDSALDTAVPGSPTAGSINERVKTMDDAGMPASLTTISGLVDTAESAGPFSYLDAGGEQDVVEDTAVTRRHIKLEFSNRNMAQTGTFKVYRKIDGTNYDLYASQAVTVGAGDERAFDAEFSTNQAWKLTYTEDVDEGGNKAIPFNVITQVVE